MASYIELLGLFVLLMLPFLYETNHIFRYYFKFFIYYGIVSFNSVILIPAFLARPCDVRNLLWASTFCHRVSTLIGLRWELRGKEHLEKERACIIVANHQSSLDVLGMFDIWHVMNKCTVVAKRELFYAWPFGLAAWLAGLIFIDRVRGEKARATLNAVNSRIKKQKIKLWVFPEGTRRNTGEIHAFKKGAFHMAIDEQIPIMPVVFSSYCTFLNDKKKILNAGNIIVTTLPPISTTGLTKDNIDMLMEHVHRQMSEVYKITSAEVLLRYKPHKAASMATTPNVPVSSSSTASVALTAKNCSNNSSSNSSSASNSGSTSSTSISNSSCNNTVVVTTSAATATAAPAAETTQYSRGGEHYVNAAASSLASTIATPTTMLKKNILSTVTDIEVLDDSGGGDGHEIDSGGSDFDDNDVSDENYKSSISGKAADTRKTLQAL